VGCVRVFKKLRFACGWVGDSEMTMDMCLARLESYLQMCETAVETLADYVDGVDTWLVGGATGRALKQCDHVMTVFHLFDREAMMVGRGFCAPAFGGGFLEDARARYLGMKIYNDRIVEMAKVKDHFRVCLIRLKHLGVCLD